MSLVRLIILCILLAISGIYWWSNLPTQTSTEYNVKEISRSWPEVVQFARENLPMQGVLRQKSDGFVYLKVDDRYIQTLFPMLSLKEFGFQEPSYIYSKRGPGAHVSVFYADEHVRPNEVGQVFQFKVDKIILVKTSKATFAVLQINSPELEKLRESYGLSPKIHGKEFHISLAKKEGRRGP